MKSPIYEGDDDTFNYHSQTACLGMSYDWET